MLTGPLTLATALACAAEHNVDVWVARQERLFQRELTFRALLEMLPTLPFGVDSARRSEYDAAQSVSLARGTQSLQPSYSSEKEIRTWDLGAAWNLLDLGIGYLRTRQQDSQVQIAAERERRVRQNLALEVTRVYWQAVTARVIAEEAAQSRHALDAVMARLQAEMDEKTISQADGLRRATALLEQQQELNRYRRAYLAALAELATLVGLPPGTPVELAPVVLDEPLAPREVAVEALEWEALHSRPELYEKDLEQQISRDEAWVALAQMFPSLSFFWRYSEDENQYLVFNTWYTAGLNLTWDLVNIPRGLQQHRVATLQADLVGQRRTALAAAILTQLHLALIEWQETTSQHRAARELADQHRLLLAAVESAANEGMGHGGEALEQRLRYLKARARELSLLAELMAARARVFNSVGREPDGRDEDVLGGAPPPVPVWGGEDTR